MGVERVRDVDDPRLADYRDLRDGERRRRDRTFIAESRQVVRRLLGGARLRARSGLAPRAGGGGLRDGPTRGLPAFRAARGEPPRAGGFTHPPRWPAVAAGGAA